MKKPAAIFFALVLAVIMCGCCAKHNFSPATCTTAATCTKCGETNGSALGITSAKRHAQKPASAADAVPRRAARSVINGSMRTVKRR